MLKIPRRQLIRGAAGAALSVPFARRFSEEALAAGNPRRLLVFWTANGIVPGTRAELLKELGAHQADLTVLTNITYSGTGDHKTGMPFSTTGYTLERKGISIDQEVARGIDGTRPGMVLCGQSKNENYRGYTSQDASGAWVAPIRSPKTAFESIFGPITGGGPVTPPPGPVVQGYGDEVEKKILATAVADADALRARLPKAELIKMDEQIAALNNISKALQPTGGGGPVGGTPATVDCVTANGTPFAATDPGYDDRVRLHADLIAAAFACDARRVATLMMSPGGHDSMSYSAAQTTESLGGDIHNNIAHHFGDDPNNARKMSEIARYEARKLGYLIGRLKEVGVYDDTLILWTSECSGPNHGHQGIPAYVIPGRNIALKRGATVDMTGNSYLKVLISIARAVGHTNLASFGDPAQGGDEPMTALHA